MRAAIKRRRKRQLLHLRHRGLRQTVIVIPKRHAPKAGKPVNDALPIIGFNAHPVPAHRHGRGPLVGMQAGICLSMDMVQTICGAG